MTDEDLAQARVGATLRNKYKLERLLGYGGMGAVYAATHRNRKQFAIKMLHASLSANGEVRERFLREGRIANTVAHAGAVAVLDDDVAEDGSAFLVMELLEGTSVEDLRRERGLSLGSALALVEQVLEVLEAAHAKSITHRDLKPANLFILADGTVKVLDFGIARLREPQLVAATKTGATLGTPGFMAPEQARGDNDKLDSLVDIWALGATLFQVLSGQLVYPGDNAMQLLVQAATQPARSLASVTTQLPVAVVELVDRALAFDKAARWPSAAAMRDAVRVVRAELAPGTLLESASSVLREELTLPTMTTMTTMTTMVAERAPQTQPGTRHQARTWQLVAFGFIALGATGAWLALHAAPVSKVEHSVSAAHDHALREAAKPALAPLPAADAPAQAPSRALAAAPPTAESQTASALVAAPPQPSAAPRVLDLPQTTTESQPRPSAQQPTDPQPQLAPAPVVRSRAPASAATSAACARLLEKQSLGEPLSNAEIAQLRAACR